MFSRKEGGREKKNRDQPQMVTNEGELIKCSQDNKMPKEANVQKRRKKKKKGSRKGEKEGERKEFKSSSSFKRRETTGK